MGSFLFTIFSFLVALGVLITVHEYGHFWVARKLGVKVLRFSIGFGKPLWKHTSRIDGIEYVLAAIPLGGYVKMLDEREEQEERAAIPEEELSRAFNRQSLPVRSAIVVAGPVSNFLFAILAFWLILMAGETGLRPLVAEVEPGSMASAAGFAPGDEIVAVDGENTPTWESAAYEILAASVDRQDLSVRVRDDRGVERVRLLPAAVLDGLAEEPNPIRTIGLSPRQPVIPPVIGELIAGEAAERAGLRVGDRVTAVDGQPVKEWIELVRYVQARPDQVLEFELERAEGRHSVKFRVGTKEANGKRVGFIGAGVQEPDDGLPDEYRILVRLGPLDALGASFGKTWDISWLILRMAGRMLTGEASVKNLSGPISIAQSAGKTASYGVIPFLRFLAWVSISLGVLNLLPIPVLDGGHLLYFLIEAVKGSPLTERAQAEGQRIGLVILLMLMGLAFYVDISRLLG